MECCKAPDGDLLNSKHTCTTPRSTNYSIAGYVGAAPPARAAVLLVVCIMLGNAAHRVMNALRGRTLATGSGGTMNGRLDTINEKFAEARLLLQE